MPRLRTGCGTLAYTHDKARTDTLPGIVFLPGFRSHRAGEKASHLRALAAASGWAFTAIDYRGHGASTGHFERCGITDWTDDALAVLDAIPHQRQVLVGSSMGAWIAVRVAMALPERTAAVVTVAAAPDFTADLLWPSLSDRDKAALQAGKTVFRPSDYGDGPYPISARLFERSRDALVLRERIPLHCPLRALHGEQDTEVPIRSSALLMQQWQGCDKKLLRIAGGDHRLSRPADLVQLGDAVRAVIESEFTAP